LLRALPLAALGVNLATMAPARAMVPYVYVPPAAGIWRGPALESPRRPARLLRLGQAGDAARLAALTVQLLPDDPRGWVLLAEVTTAQPTRSSQLRPSPWHGRSSLDPTQCRHLVCRGLSGAAQRATPAEADGACCSEGLKRFDGPATPGAYFDLGNARLLLGDPRTALARF
jgi:hypothetical protein